MARKALVTLLIGDDYRSIWERTARPGWERYAARHGYDIVIIDRYLDTTARAATRSPHWQKCLIFRDARLDAYDHVVWLDADVAINPVDCPCIVAAKTTDRIGAVVMAGQPDSVGRVRYGRLMERLTGRPWPFYPGFYQMCGLERPIDRVINTGVLVFDRGAAPAEHLEQVYAGYEQSRDSMFENVPLSYHLLDRDLVEPLDPRFNVIWPHQMFEHYAFLLNGGPAAGPVTARACVNMALRNAHFLHFVGYGPSRGHMDLLDYSGDWDRIL